MAEFRSVQLDVVDSAGRNPRDDRHYFGLVRSVVICVQRMVAECRDEAEKEDAVGLLMAMSLLHRSEIPVRLFCGDAALTPSMQATATAACTPSGRLEWLFRLTRESVKQYTASATDVPIPSTPKQVRAGE